MDGERVEYATFQDNDQKIELISKPYGSLIKLVDGKKSYVEKEDVIVWTRVCGWLGIDEIASIFKNKKDNLRR